MVFVVGSQGTISEVSPKTLLFLCASGITTGASWICYYKALQIGEATKVVPIDKFSIVLTMLLAFVILHEQITVYKLIGILLITAGTFVMLL